MWSTLFWICVGILIGWNLPQPAWASVHSRRFGLARRAKGIARGPNSSPITPQKTGLPPRRLAIAWQATTEASSRSAIRRIAVMSAAFGMR